MRLQAQEEKRVAKELKRLEMEEAKLRKLAEQQRSRDEATSKKRPQVSTRRQTLEKATTASKSPEGPKRISARSGRNIRSPRRYV
jgi:hypothetical protein